MSTKYSISERERWRMQSDSRPRLSDHVVGGPAEDGPGRWDERTPAGATSPERAWELGEDLPDYLLPWFENAMERQPDQVRLFAERVDGQFYAVLFPVVSRGDRCVTTVMRVDSIWDAPRRAYLNSRAVQFIKELKQS